MRQEKEREEFIIGKIKKLKSERNKARLLTGKTNPASKRLKVDQETYISIRKIWGAPKITAPQKTGFLEGNDLHQAPPNEVVYNRSPSPRKARDLYQAPATEVVYNLSLIHI